MVNATTVPLERRLTLLHEDTDRLASVLERTGFTMKVPSCPEWTLGDLAFHVGEVHRFWTWIAREEVQDPEAVQRPEAVDPPDAELAAWLRQGADELISVLREADPSTPVWSWAPQHDMGFIQRRMPHETSVHRWDAEDTAGRHDASIATDLAADGISEYLFLATAKTYEGEARLALHSADTGHDWTGWLDEGQLRWEVGVADAPATLTGSASDLLLTLWRRRELSEGRVQVTGDRAAVARFLALADLD